MNVNDESYQKQEKVRGTRKCPTPGCDSSSNTNPLRKSHISQNYCPIFTSSNKSFRTNESDKENELSDLLEKVKIKKGYFLLIIINDAPLSIGPIFNRYGSYYSIMVKFRPRTNHLTV